ncbi:FeS cluster formation protein SufB [Streptococcus infantarius subsp. infantarius]|nr:FeS cluster formation protein SufB [Streptococcus infantarius subsp. infantarius]
MPEKNEKVEPKPIDLGEYKYGFHDDVTPVFSTGKGISEDVVRAMSAEKEEPEWMLEFRLKSLETFNKMAMQEWGPDLSGINFDDLTYFQKASEKPARDWEDVPEKIKETFERIGIPEAERAYLAGASAQYESEVVYHNMKEEYDKLGIIFTDTDSALKEHPELFKKYFSKLVPPTDNKFAALNSAFWSGGTFIYVPKGVKVDIPLQTYFRINNEATAQFERTLIIVDEGASVHYVEGCTAPTYTTASLHAAIVEIFALEGAYMRYSTIQNWSDNVYNLVTKRATAKKNATVEWIDGNLGAEVTMKYPSVYLDGEGARGTMLSIAFANKGQHQDTGAKMIHNAPHTSSSIVSKSIAKGGGKVDYRGQVTFNKNSKKSVSHIECDTILMDDISSSDTIPFNEIHNSQVALEHEAKVSKISEEQLYYLMSRGLSEQEATEMIVMGFVEPFTKELPMEYAVELNRLISYEMEGSVG